MQGIQGPKCISDTIASLGVNLPQICSQPQRTCSALAPGGLAVFVRYSSLINPHDAFDVITLNAIPQETQEEK